MRRLTLRETVLVVIAAALAVLVPLYTLVFAPQLGVMSLLSRHVDAQNRQLAAVNASAGRLPALERDQAGLAARVQQEQQRIPATISVSGLMSRFSVAIAVSGVQLIEVAFPQGTQPIGSTTDPIQELPVTMRIRGTFEHVVSFLQQIEAAPPVAAEQAVSIGGGAPPAQGNGEGNLEVTVSMKAIALR